MKKIIILFIILTTCVFSQGWNTTVSTSISEPNLIKMDLFTNKDGNHIIVQNSNSTNSIKYYLLNSSGAVVRSSTIETAGGAEFPNISGDNDNVYLVYKSGNYLKAKKSTDAGQNWNNITIQPLSIGSNICNGVDIVYDYQGLHVVYAMKDNDPYYETYYYKLNSSNSWVDYKNVTDYNVDEVGGFPTVTVSSNRVHVSYNTGYSQNPGNQGDAKTRDKNGSAWENPQIVSSGANNLSSAEKLQVKGTTLFDFYYLFVDGGGNFGNSLMVKTRSTSGTTWSSATELGYNVDISPFMGSETTADQNLHIVYSDDSNLYHRQFSSYWNSTYTITSYPSAPYNTTFGLGKASNDLFCIWKPLSSNLLSFRQYDLAPLTPANLSISINSGDESVISWTANLEPDVKISGGKYKIYRAETTGGEPTSFTLVATIDAYSGDTPVTSWIDTESGKSYTRKLFYKISAMDKNLHESALTNYVWRYGKIPKISTGGFSILEYKLFDNYPNPFNPRTKITYSIKEEGLVTLKIYDVLGKEIATLVNENKPSGNYEAEFDASQLPSGIYIYKLQAGSFISSKKMLLLK